MEKLKKEDVKIGKLVYLLRSVKGLSNNLTPVIITTDEDYNDEETQIRETEAHYYQATGKLFFNNKQEGVSEIKDIIIHKGNTMWWVEKASDIEEVENAILDARVTGSVGVIREHRNAEPPFGDGRLLRYATVSRIEKVKPQ